MPHPFSRTQLLLGRQALQKLKDSHVAVFGVGGVGGYAVEVLARSGVGSITVVDNDRVEITNINRQIIALHSTIGQLKVDVIARRIADINPDCHVTALHTFYLPSNADEIDLSAYDYVVDCIDTVAAKLELIRRCYELHEHIISSMGAANKMDATAFRVADINQTQIDPLAKVIRKKLRKLGIESLKVVFSEETPLPYAEGETPPLAQNDEQTEGNRKRMIPASNAFVPAAAGLIIGGEVVKDIIKRPCSVVNDSSL